MTVHKDAVEHKAYRLRMVLAAPQTYSSPSRKHSKNKSCYAKTSSNAACNNKTMSESGRVLDRTLS
eukprot:6305113-Amphidinium_carterae.1